MHIHPSLFLQSVSLKNLFDWLSLPLVVGDYETLTSIKAEVMEQQTGIVLNLEAWTEGRMILSDEQKEALKDQVEAFLKFV